MPFLNLSLKSHKELTYKQGLLTLGIIYFSLMVAYLISYQGIPYVFDNNESFSSIVHARNLIQFDFFKSYGLTDESFGILESAHPYVYTHQGNFPRLFSALLYLVGMQSIEWQIVGHLIIVNTLALYFAYYYFAKKVSPLFAIIYCFILLTDYVMNFQWQFNTWRVWHCFFIFSSLILVDKYKEISNRYYIPIVLLNFISLAYYEITFAVFIIVLCSVLFIFKYKHSKDWFLPVCYIALGALIGFGILVFQSILYFDGLKGFLSDFRFTFTARNQSPAGSLEFAALAGQVWDFVESWNLVFWGNFVSSADNLRNILTAFELFSRYNLMVYSPIFIFIIIILIFTWLLGKILNRFENSKIYILEEIKDNNESNQLYRRLFLSFILLVFACIVLFGSSIITHIQIEEFQNTKYSLILYVLIVAALVHWAFLSRINLNLAHQASNVSLKQIIIVMTFFTTVFVYGMMNHKLFKASMQSTADVYIDFWSKVSLFDYFGGSIAKIVFICALFFGLFSLTREPLYRFNQILPKISGIYPLIFAAIIGGIVSWNLLPGYILTAYYNRYVPFFEYITILIIVIPLYILTLMLINGIFTVLKYYKNNLIRYLILIAPLFIIYVYLIFAWIFLQFSYFTEYKTGTNLLLKTLGAEQYKSASIVSGGYAAPFAIQTNQWAYLDPDFHLGRVNRGEDGFYYGSDNKYLWLADKKTNPNYKTPDYYVCSMNAHYDFIMGFNPRCDVNVELIKNIKNSEGGNFSQLIKPIIADEDPSGKSSWAIIKLDNDFPPFLRLLEGQRFIDISTDTHSLSVNYKYFQQFNNPEGYTTIGIHKLQACDDKRDPALISEGSANKIPVSKLRDGVYQVSVTPKSKTKLGETYLSSPFKVSAGNVAYCPIKEIPYTPEDLFVKSTPDGRNGVLSWSSQEGMRYFDIGVSKDGHSYSPLSNIDGEKRDIRVGNAMAGLKNFYRVRACNDWVCSKWAVLNPQI